MIHPDDGFHHLHPDFAEWRWKAAQNQLPEPKPHAEAFPWLAGGVRSNRRESIHQFSPRRHVQVVPDRVTLSQGGIITGSMFAGKERFWRILVGWHEYCITGESRPGRRFFTKRSCERFATSPPLQSDQPELTAQALDFTQFPSWKSPIMFRDTARPTLPVRSADTPGWNEEFQGRRKLHGHGSKKRMLELLRCDERVFHLREFQNSGSAGCSRRGPSF